MLCEAFVYMWYDSVNGKYYIGYHKGTPDDGYTHSSSIMPKFKADNVPPGFRRRIIAYGSVEEMKNLEVQLIKNRRKKCKNLYWNKTIPRTVSSTKENSNSCVSAHIFTDEQFKHIINETLKTRKALRNRTIIELTYYAGLKVSEISKLKWINIFDENKNIGTDITFPDNRQSYKKFSVDTIPMNKKLRKTLTDWFLENSKKPNFNPNAYVIYGSNFQKPMSTQSLTNFLWLHYNKICGIEGASSHSGRRTFIMNALKKCSFVGGSLCDVEKLARTSIIPYLETNMPNKKMQRDIVDLL